MILFPFQSGHKLPELRLARRLQRPLMQETRAVFEKLHKFIGKNLKNLVERSDEDHVFRLHKNRIYYIRESLLKRSTNVSL